MKTSSHMGRFLLAALLSLAALAEPALAQPEIRTTIIGEVDAANAKAPSFDTDRRIVLLFRTRALPANAEVVGATLQLTAAEMPGNADATNVTIRVNYTEPVSGQWRDQNFGSIEFERGMPGVDRTARWQVDRGASLLGSIKGGDTIAVRLAIEPVNLRPGQRTRQWYSAAATDTARRPRLILEYKVPGRPEPVQAVGLGAVQSPAHFLPMVTAPAAVPELRVHLRRFADAKPLSFTPAFGNGLVYLTADDEGKAALQARSPLTGALLWPQPVALENAGQHLVASPTGRLYIVGNEHIHAYRLDTSAPGKSPTPERAADGKWTGARKVDDLKPQIAPTVGPDGSLYIFNNGRMVAFNPDLQELWKSKEEDKRISPITVGPSGRFVYLVSAIDGLVAFDTATGERSSIALPNQPALKDYDHPDLHAPVVTRDSDGTERIYAAANDDKSGSLAVFDNFRTRTEPLDVGMTQVWTSPSPWSQLVPLPNSGSGAGPIVGIRRSDTENFTVEVLQVATGPVGQSGPAVKAEVRARGATKELGKEVWTTFGRPVVDRARDVLTWHNARNALQVFLESNPRLLEPTSARVSVSRLMFGSDGTLYAEREGDRALRVVLPEVLLTGQAGVTVKSPTHLRASGSSGVNTKLCASGSIVFASGTRLAGGTKVRAGQPPQSEC